MKERVDFTEAESAFGYCDDLLRGRHKGRQSFGQNEQNVQNRGNGISQIEGKGAMGSAERGGRRASFKRFRTILLIL